MTLINICQANISNNKKFYDNNYSDFSLYNNIKRLKFHKDDSNTRSDIKPIFSNTYVEYLRVEQDGDYCYFTDEEWCDENKTLLHLHTHAL